MSFNSRFLMGLCIGMLIDEDKLKLEDKLDKYISEYTHSSEITYLYLDWETGIGLIHLTNSELIIQSQNGSLSQFRKEFRQEAAATFVYPNNPRLVPFSKNNVWDAMQLSINDEQLEYMSNAKEAICIAYAYKHELFIIMEGNRSIGLVAFSMDSKNKKYYIESVLIDKKYQQRGFGKIMMIKGIEYLKSIGCTHLSIGVNLIKSQLCMTYLKKGQDYQQKQLKWNF